jgi:UDP-glucose:(glucosyl)LPS alpha-1,2-glucosyltransferase
MELANDGTAINGNGGSELVKRGILEHCNPKLLEQFKVIHSRVREEFFEEGKHHILLCHDLWNDPENKWMLEEEQRKRFKKLVFVSEHQAHAYQLAYQIKFSEMQIIRNGITPFQSDEIETNEVGEDDQIRLIYHTTPHRGLEILVPVFERLYQNHGDKIHLDVFSSFNAYGWGERDKQYQHLFDACEKHEGITYHGFQPNDVVREYLKKAHIFAYPSIWPETSCIAAIESLSSKTLVVCPRFGSLGETTANYGVIYPMHEDYNVHANRFIQVLDRLLNKKVLNTLNEALSHGKTWADNMYSWHTISREWDNLFNTIVVEEEQKPKTLTL